MDLNEIHFKAGFSCLYFDTFFHLHTNIFIQNCSSLTSYYYFSIKVFLVIFDNYSHSFILVLLLSEANYLQLLLQGFPPYNFSHFFSPTSGLHGMISIFSIFNTESTIFWLSLIFISFNFRFLTCYLTNVLVSPSE